MSHEQLAGRRALVTGGARGLGAAVALALAEAGCDLVLLDDPGAARSTLDYALATDPDAEHVLSKVRAMGRSVVLHRVDVRDHEATVAAVHAAESSLPGIDVVVLAAHVGSVVGIDEMTDASWNDVVDTNLHGAYHVIHTIWPQLLGRPGARVVFLLPPEARSGAAYRSHYAGAAWASVGLMKSLAAEGAPTGVAVNAVCTTATDGPEFDAPRELAMRAGRAPTVPTTRAETEHEMRVRHPTGEAVVDSATVVDAVLFLLGQASTAMTGSIIEVGQGMSSFNES